MLGQCSSCSQNVGFFKLQETLCKSCLSGTEGKGKLARTFSSSPFWSFIFVVGFAAHIALIVIKPSAEQVALSSGFMVVALVSFAFSFVIRFFLLRRSVHIALAIVLSLPFAVSFLAAIGIVGSSPASLTTLGFIFFPYYVLRSPNMSLSDNQSGI